MRLGNVAHLAVKRVKKSMSKQRRKDIERRLRKFGKFTKLKHLET